MNPPAGSPDLLDPAAPLIQPYRFLPYRLPMVAPSLMYAAYSLHYVGGTGPGQISADYFGRFCSNTYPTAAPLLHPVRRSSPCWPTGRAVISTISYFRSPRPGQPPYAQINGVADDVAQRVHAAMNGLNWQDSVELQVDIVKSPFDGVDLLRTAQLGTGKTPRTCRGEQQSRLATDLCGANNGDVRAAGIRSSPSSGPACRYAQIGSCPAKCWLRLALNSADAA